MSVPMAARTVHHSQIARTLQNRTSADAEKDTSMLVRDTDFSLEGTRFIKNDNLEYL